MVRILWRFSKTFDQKEKKIPIKIWKFGYLEIWALIDELDIIVLDNDLQSETTEGILDTEDVHESENIGLKKDKILRIIDVLNDASDIASEFDIYYERAHVFKNRVFFQRKKIKA